MAKDTGTETVAVALTRDEVAMLRNLISQITLGNPLDSVELAVSVAHKLDAAVSE